MIIDAHTHLNDLAFKDDIDQIVERAKNNNVVSVINTADTLESFDTIIKLMNKYPDFCLGALGIHPNEVKGLEDLDVLNEYLEKKIKGIVAVGEIGLDYHYEPTNLEKETQMLMFKAQIDIAQSLNLPIVIHSRDADYATFDAVINTKPTVPVYLHCYSGSYEMAQRYIDNGIDVYFGVGGVVTFKNAKKLLEVVTNIGIDRLLLETDAPYLSPVPHRGERNEPSYLDLVVSKIAELKKIDREEVEKAIYENTKKVFNL